ncbi:MAG: hypothetical protein HC769_34515 [Cyanobacteria bacterium CRU_2_1]|nr:hypothetical protein [Cyanobacteria bacterium CRU_2_1]
MSDNYELGRDIGKLQVAIENLQARFDKLEGEATVQEGIPRIMQEVPESFVSLEVTTQA